MFGILAKAEDLATYIFFDPSELLLTCTFGTLLGLWIAAAAADKIRLANRV